MFLFCSLDALPVLTTGTSNLAPLPVNQLCDHLITELPVVVHKLAAVVIAGPDGPFIDLHGFEQFHPPGIESVARIGSVGIDTRTIVGGTYCPESIFISPLQMFHLAGLFHASVPLQLTLSVCPCLFL